MENNMTNQILAQTEPLELNEYERTLLEETVRECTDYEIIIGVITPRRLNFLRNVLGTYIQANLEDEDNITTYAALLGRISEWLDGNFPLEGKAEEPVLAPTLTICLTSEQVDTLIFALEHSHVWSWEMVLKAQTPVQHYETRRLLLESLRAWVDPTEMTAEEILAREG